ncbi:MAG TPA: alcohol dehydrogenase family protein [Cyclobacteriaceae bacterium]
MRALTFQGKEKISFESIPDPRIIDQTDVIVRVKLSCICGSDLHVYYEDEKGLDPGTAMGHEFVGEIIDVGSDVKHLQVGDVVMSPFTTNCGTCFYCKIGLTCRCVKGQLYGWVEKGEGLQGGQAEYVRVPLADSTLQKIPDGISMEEGLLLGDVLSTGYFCAYQAEIKSNKVNAVIGCGPVGLMTIVGAREQGAENLYAIDSVEERLAMAEKFGAIPINLKAQNPLDILREKTNGRGVDAVMEAVGSGGAAKLAYELLRPGGIISTVGVCNEKHLSFSPVEAYNKNITYKVGRCPARYFMNRLVPMVQEKKYNLTSILTHRMKLSEGAKGYDIFANKKDNCLKVILEV